MKLPEKWQKVLEQKGETLFNKVLGENEKCVFYFYLKTEGTYGHPVVSKLFTQLVPCAQCWGETREQKIDTVPPGSNLRRQKQGKKLKWKDLTLSKDLTLIVKVVMSSESFDLTREWLGMKWAGWGRGKIDWHLPGELTHTAQRKWW